MSSGMPGSEAPSWTPPATFEEYRVVALLSRGGMGEVYLGHDALLDRPVAIKFIRAVEPDAVMREQFLIEARAAARLQHPNVVTIYRVCEIDSHPCIISELVRGQSLHSLWKPVPWHRALELGIGLSRGLAAAHRRGVLHRDIKPSNVILSTDGEVKLLDFGLAEFVEIPPLSVEAMEPAWRVRDVSSMPETTEVPLAESKEWKEPEKESPKEPKKAEAPPEPKQRGQAEPRREPESEIAEPKEPKEPRIAVVPKGEGPVLVPMAGVVGPVPVPTPAEPSAGDALPEGAAALDLPESGSKAPVGRRKRHSRIVGTPHYMAPELLNGEPSTRQTDVYAMGALLFELCTGVPPYPDSNLRTLLRSVANKEPPALLSLAPDVDPRFAAIVDRCLRRDPGARYASADELRDSLEQLRPREREIVVPEGNPYRGLFAFEAEHRSLFFGRSNEIGTIIERLRTEAFILVAADSGFGKSSLCRAGVLPLIREGALGSGRQWQVQSLVPGRNLLESLCTVLSPILQSDVGRLAEQLLADPTSLGRELHKHLSDREGLVLFIDQLEEVVTISDPVEVAAVGKALGYLVNRIAGVRMLMTARSDFLARIAQVPGLGDEIGHALYFLRPMPPAGIREAIVAPARAKGVHFESEAMIDMLVAETAQTDGGLPLLQFALTQLWDARADSSITQRSMEAIGGVTGALARHADQVLLGLPSEQRLAARHVLMLLVTIEGTRARRTAEELGQGPAVRQAIEALVRGRLIVARDTGEGAVYEVAHEALLKGWVTLRHWLEEFAEHRAIRQRIEAATAEWLRMHRAKDALWSSRQLAEAGLIDEEDLTPKERSFLMASRQALQRGRRMRNAALFMIPLVLAMFYGGIRYRHMRERDRAVAEHTRRGLALLDEARQREAEVQALRSKAFVAFDSQKKDEGEALWARSLKLGARSADSFAQASQALEAALFIDSSRTDVRSLLADALYESAMEAEGARQPGRRAALVQRLALYDQGGMRQQRLNAPARLSLQTSPPGARVRLQRYVEDDNQRRQLTGERELGTTPLKEVSLPAGSYLLSLSFPGHVPVRYPVLLRRAEELRVSFDLPIPKDVPEGYVYIPPGRFLFGTSSEEPIRQAFLSTVPLHEVASLPYLIGKKEVTYADWIEFLSALPKEERVQRSIRVPKGGMGGGVELRETEDGRWQLTLQLTTQVYTAKTGEPIVYGNRKLRREHDWMKLPVAGISPQDTRAYAEWLSRSGRVPGARLCTDHEWERAARGADEREYPHGDLLAPQDANFDETYGKEQRSAGPDTVGSYPAGESPFGLLDMAGNVNEWVDSSLVPGEVAARSGGYFLGGIAARSTNRTTLDPDFRDPAMGARICAAIPTKR